MRKHQIAILAALAVLALAKHAHGAELDLTVNGLSKHTRADFNGINPGLGLHVGLGTVGLDLGEYKNSYKNTTAYALGEWLPLQVSGLRVGAFAGLATGYTEPQNPIRPLVAGFAARWQPGPVGVAFHVVPPTGPGTAGFVAVQLTIRIKE